MKWNGDNGIDESEKERDDFIQEYGYHFCLTYLDIVETF